LCRVYGHTQAHNKTSSKALYTSVDKTSYTSSDFEFTRLIRGGDNPHKKTLTHTHTHTYTHTHYIYIYLTSPSSECAQPELLSE